MNNKAHLRPKDFDSNGDIIPMACKEEKGDLISREALKKAIEKAFDKANLSEYEACVCVCEIYDKEIDNAPTVDISKEVWNKSNELLNKRLSYLGKPQGEREFIEILAQYVPDDICTYPEYKGKPYYSIHYKENGEEFVGFGTYNPEVLSRYLKEYFVKGGAT